jgi:hypothetical protein
MEKEIHKKFYTWSLKKRNRLGGKTVDGSGI